MNPTDKKANVKLSLAGGKPSTMKYNEPIRRCLSANSALTANLKSGERSEDYSTRLGSGYRYQWEKEVRTEHSSQPPAWSLVLICGPSKENREGQKRKPGVKRVTQKSELAVREIWFLSLTCHCKLYDIGQVS